MLFLDAACLLFIHALYFAKTDYLLVCGYCHGIWWRPAWTFSSKAFPVFPFALPSPHFSHPPTLPPPPPFFVFVMLSLSLRGHTVTLFTGSHAGVSCVGVRAWMKVCVCARAILSLFPDLFDHYPNQISICQSVGMHILYTHRARWLTYLVGPNLSNNLSINVHFCI